MWTAIGSSCGGDLNRVCPDNFLSVPGNTKARSEINGFKRISTTFRFGIGFIRSSGSELSVTWQYMLEFMDHYKRRIDVNLYVL